MFWDKAAVFYDLFETVYNGKVNRELPLKVAERMQETDRVLECACGTGLISRRIAQNCQELVATDFSVGMLRQAQRKCRRLANVKLRKADIMHLNCRDGAFDKVVAGNVIHLLEDPRGAMAELERVCRTGGEIIIPTYVNHEKTGKSSLVVRLIEKFGAGFKKQFDYQTYQQFFADMGYTDVEYRLVEGRMPCAIAVITKKQKQ